MLEALCVGPSQFSDNENLQACCSTVFCLHLMYTCLPHQFHGHVSWKQCLQDKGSMHEYMCRYCHNKL